MKDKLLEVTLWIAGMLLALILGVFLAVCVSFYIGDAKALGLMVSEMDVPEPEVAKAAALRLSILVALAIGVAGGAFVWVNRRAPAVAQGKKILVVVAASGFLVFWVLSYGFAWAYLAMVAVLTIGAVCGAFVLAERFMPAAVGTMKIMAVLAGVAWYALWVGASVYSHRREEPPSLTFLDLLQFWPVTKGIQKASSFTLYEGLPHQVSEKTALAAEIATKKTVQIYNFHFYERTSPIRTEDEAALRRLVTSTGSFGTYTMKLCGGFHPDYCLAWSEGETTYYVLLCFGCHEVILYDKKRVMAANVREGAFPKLEAILERYGSQRPARE